MTRRRLGLVASVALVTLLYGASPASAQTAPSLGSADSFAVLAGSTVTNTGSSVITGDLGVSPGSAVTGFPPGVVVSGTIHAADATAGAAQNSVVAAYNTLSGQLCTQDLTGQDLGGKTLIAGVYCFSTSAQLTGTLTLNAQGNAGAVFIFKIGSTLTTASNSSIVMINGGSVCNVFWQVGSSATVGTTTSFAGNILALSSITLTTGATLRGRALARTGAVTLDSNTVGIVGCGAAPAPGPTPNPALCSDTAPDLFITKRHTDLFVAGSNATYSIGLFNYGKASSGAITVTDRLPTGLTAVAATGVGWTCTSAGQVVSCTTTGSVAAASPFPNSITLTVMPGLDAVPGLTNTATVTGGSDCDLTNNTTADITLVTLPIPVPTLSEWAFIMLAVLLAAAGVIALRRRTSA
jgi:uncharacterized repeat protein (TIGR01451 family)